MKRPTAPPEDPRSKRVGGWDYLVCFSASNQTALPEISLSFALGRTTALEGEKHGEK